VTRVVVAPDKFRGSLTAAEAAAALARGVVGADRSARVTLAPVADGGEGTVDALVSATGGARHTATVADPLGRPVSATYGRLGDGRTAVIEMASASGLALLTSAERDPLRTSTRGTGELLLAALSGGARRVILGIGGSATNDGGSGFAQAMGFRLLDRDGRDLGPGGGALGDLDRIETAGVDPRLAGLEVAVACDVDHPLCGPRGASAVFGPQKGADRRAVDRLDANLDHFARVIARDLGVEVRDLPGSGAAGGLGGGLVAFAGGRLGPGIDLVLEAVGLADHLRGADLCLTGEGCLDATSAGGKAAVGVARLARSLGVPTLAIAGTLGPGAEGVLSEGVAAVFSLCPGPIGLDEALGRAGVLLERAGEQAVRCFLAGRDRQGWGSP